MKGIRKVCQLMERCDGHVGCVRTWRGVNKLRVYLTVTGEV